MKISATFRGIYLIVEIVLLMSLVEAQDSLKGIIPLVTTRREVERKLGKPDKFGRYEFDEGRMHILYRENECSKSNLNCFCLVPLGTVLKISFEPYYDLYVKDLKLDPELFKRSEVTGGHVSGITVYVNKKAGILYEVRENGKVSDIEYFESEKTCRMLEQKAAKKETSNKSVQ